MTVEIRCDFCDKLIKTKKGKNHPTTIDSVEVKEYICKDCKTTDLQQSWKDLKNSLDKEWIKIEKEKRNFFKSLLENQKKEWLIEKKKKHFGTYYKEEK